MLTSLREYEFQISTINIEIEYGLEKNALQLINELSTTINAKLEKIKCRNN